MSAINNDLLNAFFNDTTSDNDVASSFGFGVIGSDGFDAAAALDKESGHSAFITLGDLTKLQKEAQCSYTVALLPFNTRDCDWKNGSIINRFPTKENYKIALRGKNPEDDLYALLSQETITELLATNPKIKNKLFGLKKQYSSFNTGNEYVVERDFGGQKKPTHAFHFENYFILPCVVLKSDTKRWVEVITPDNEKKRFKENEYEFVKVCLLKLTHKQYNDYVSMLKKQLKVDVSSRKEYVVLIDEKTNKPVAMRNGNTLITENRGFSSLLNTHVINIKNPDRTLDSAPIEFDFEERNHLFFSRKIEKVDGKVQYGTPELTELGTKLFSALKEYADSGKRPFPLFDETAIREAYPANNFASAYLTMLPNFTDITPTIDELSGEIPYTSLNEFALAPNSFMATVDDVAVNNNGSKLLDYAVKKDSIATTTTAQPATTNTAALRAVTIATYHDINNGIEDADVVKEESGF